MLSEMIPCPNELCQGGIETKDGIRRQCPACKGKGYIVEPIRQPPGADFFAGDSEAG